MIIELTLTLKLNKFFIGKCYTTENTMEQSNMDIQSFQMVSEVFVNKYKRMEEELCKAKKENEELVNENKRLQTANEELVNENKRLQLWEYYAQVLEGFVWSSWLETRMHDADCFGEYLGERDDLAQSHPKILEDDERIMREQESRANAVD